MVYLCAGSAICVPKSAYLLAQAEGEVTKAARRLAKAAFSNEEILNGSFSGREFTQLDTEKVFAIMSRLPSQFLQRIERQLKWNE